jgi:glycosyltransferase involved in cell wall biosynthesis
MKIYDCSNSEASLKGKARLYGPKENDILRYLKQYASEFGHVFVQNPNDADVILTNDIFPESFSGKKKVKRMDGVFARTDVVHRNEALNQAAQEADHVIFISDYSRDSYFQLYDPDRKTLKGWTTIPNEVDPSVFYPDTRVVERKGKHTSFSYHPKRMIAIASDWSRPEKRLEDLIVLAEIAPEIEFVLVGKAPDNWPQQNVSLYYNGEPVSGRIKYPKNITIKGYIDTPQGLARELREADGMVSFFYKDAYPKTMVQAKYCGLPILFAGSGGQNQMGAAGIQVPDIGSISFHELVPRLNPVDISSAWQVFEFSFKVLKKAAMEWAVNDREVAFKSMLTRYFMAME